MVTLHLNIAQGWRDVYTPNTEEAHGAVIHYFTTNERGQTWPQRRPRACSLCETVRLSEC